MDVLSGVHVNTAPPQVFLAGLGAVTRPRPHRNTLSLPPCPRGKADGERDGNEPSRPPRDYRFPPALVFITSKRCKCFSMEYKLMG